MHHACKVVFLLFYIASSYAITQERTDRQVDHFRNSAPRDSGPQLDPTCSHASDGFPNYRQAKPKSADYYFWLQDASLGQVPSVAEQIFHYRQFSISAWNPLETDLSRAPPSRH